MRLDDPDAPTFVRKWAGPADLMASGDRPASLLARALTHFLVAGIGEISRFRIAKDRRGKPHLIAPDGEIGPSISLAHSKSFAAAAVCGHGALGIDIERHKPRDVSALTAVAFGPQERAAVFQYGLEEFYRIWTLREAFAKATGIGWAQVTDRVDRFHTGPRSGSWTEMLDGNFWHLASHKIDNDYSIAVALRDSFGILPTDFAVPCSSFAWRARRSRLIWRRKSRQTIQQRGIPAAGSETSTSRVSGALRLAARTR